jgi:hypothetical protein
MFRLVKSDASLGGILFLLVALNLVISTKKPEDHQRVALKFLAAYSQDEEPSTDRWVTVYDYTTTIRSTKYCSCNAQGYCWAECFSDKYIATYCYKNANGGTCQKSTYFYNQTCGTCLCSKRQL